MNNDKMKNSNKLPYFSCLLSPVFCILSAKFSILRKSLLYSTFYILYSISTSSSAAEVKNPVYVVPDLETYLYHIAEWDSDTRFPVFIEDQKFLQKFLQAWPDAEIICSKRKRVGKITESLALKTLYAAWGPEGIKDVKKNIGIAEIKKRLAELGKTPRGIVITNISDPEFAGGLALAAGHYQLLDFYNTPYKYKSSLDVKESSLSVVAKENIRKYILSRVKDTGYEYTGLGKGIDFITLALDIAFAYRDGHALDDAINRIDNIRPPLDVKKPPEKIIENAGVYAFVGRLVEAEENMALYQAMCSLFLKVRRALYFDTYSRDMGYSTDKAWWMMLSRVNSKLVPSGRAYLTTWQKTVGERNRYGFVHINSKGEHNTWGSGTPADIVESDPCIVYFTHSNSLRDPKIKECIGGKFLSEGAYIYYGSISEPYLSSFNTAVTVMRGVEQDLPLGWAFQNKVALLPQFALPWKLMYIGDPMYRIQFLPDPDESRRSNNFRKAIFFIRNGKVEQGANILEELIQKNGGEPARQTLWELIDKSYKLFYLAAVSEKLPIAKYFPRFFIDDWYNQPQFKTGRPLTNAQLLYQRLELMKRDLHDFYTGMYHEKKNKEQLSAKMRRAIKQLATSATYAKIWLCLGPDQASEYQSNRNPFPQQINFNEEYKDKSENIVKWQIAAVDADNILDLDTIPPYKKTDIIIFAVSYLNLDAKQPQKVKLHISGDVKIKLWLDKQFLRKIQSGPEQKQYSVTFDLELKPGSNQLLLKIHKQAGQSKFSLRLTDQKENLLENVRFDDLMRRLASPSL